MKLSKKSRFDLKWNWLLWSDFKQIISKRNTATPFDYLTSQKNAKKQFKRRVVVHHIQTDDKAENEQIGFRSGSSSDSGGLWNNGNLEVVSRSMGSKEQC